MMNDFRSFLNIPWYKWIISCWPPLRPPDVEISGVHTSDICRSLVSFPTNKRRLSNVGLMLSHCRRRWPNNNPTLDSRLVFLECTPREMFQAIFVSEQTNIRPPYATMAHHSPSKRGNIFIQTNRPNYFFQFEIIINVLV